MPQPTFGRKARALIVFLACLIAVLALVILKLLPVEAMVPTLGSLAAIASAYVLGVAHEDAAEKSNGPRAQPEAPSVPPAVTVDVAEEKP
jgi:hypothetical protein